MTVRVCVDHIKSLVMWTTRNLKLSIHSTTAPQDVDGDVLSLFSPIVHDQLLGLADVEGEVVVTFILLALFSASWVPHESGLWGFSPSKPLYLSSPMYCGRRCELKLGREIVGGRLNCVVLWDVRSSETLWPQ